MKAKFRTDKLRNGNCETADNFVSPNTADFKTQTSHTMRFKNTATPQAEILFTATPHEKMPNTATPQIPNVPLNKGSEGVWLGLFSNCFNENSSILFLKIGNLDKFVIDTGRQFQIFGPW